MSTIVDPRTPTAHVSHDPDPAALRPLVTFAAIALSLGWVLLTPPVVLGLPLEPFVLPVTFLGLLAPALMLTARRSGRAGVRALLGDAVRPPGRLWWVPVAAFALPGIVWIAAWTRGGAQPLTASLVGSFLFSLVTSALIINIWEETAWAGFAQRRAMARWGTVTGSLVIALLFVGIHAPLAFNGAASPRDVVVGFGTLIATGFGLRLLIAAVDAWAAGSLLTIGVLHSAFNATSSLVDPGYDWIRLVTTVVLGVTAVTVLVSRRRSS